MAFGERSALMRATIRYREECAPEIEDHELAPLHLNEFACPRRDIARWRDHVFRQGLIPRSRFAKFPPPEPRLRWPCIGSPRPSPFSPRAPARRGYGRAE